VTIGLVLPASAFAAGDWPMWGDGSAHNSTNRAESVLGTANVSGLRVVQSYPNWDPWAAGWPYEIVAGGRGYSVEGSDSSCCTYVSSFNLATGARVWRHRISTHGDSWRYTPAYANGVIYVGGDSFFAAYKATDGTQIWKRSLPGDFNEPTVSGSTVYVTNYSRSVYALNTANGATRWSTTPAGCCLDGAVAISATKAYVLNGQLIGYNVSTGKTLWSVGSGYFDTAVVSGGVVYMTTTTQLVARSASNGALLWSASVPNADPQTSGSPPSVDGTTVIVSTQRGITAFNSATGQQRWTYNSGSDTSDYLVSAIANGVVYAGALQLGLQAFNEATGELLYTSPNMLSCTNPIVSSARVYAICEPRDTLVRQVLAFGVG
jgi:outer membrane protein assembly factor BamB